MNSLLVARRQKIALLLLFFFIGQIVQPALVYALTGGPAQPEMRSFQPAGTSEMVDLFSGDFSYNIPLFELPGPNGGYPFNLSYQSGITMEQEATWVGLGWSLNPGAITRQVRGLPDDFSGDTVNTEMNIKKNWTVSAGGGIGTEVFGMDFLKGSLGIKYRYNNYKGFGYSINKSLGLDLGGGFRADLSYTLDPEEGISLSPSIGLAGRLGSIGLTASYHSATGLQRVALNSEMRVSMDKDPSKDTESSKDQGTSASVKGFGAGLSFSFPGYTPQINFPMNTYAVSGNFKVGAGFWGLSGGLSVSGSYNEQKLSETKVIKGAYGYLNLQKAGRKSLMDINREKDGIVSKETPNLAIPNLTYDIYSVTGQGVGGMYRPIRNDYGTSWDASVEAAEGTSIGLGGDIHPVGHWGVNAEITFSANKSGRWERWASPWSFEDTKAGSSYEAWCFKVHGEHTAAPVSFDAPGGDKPFPVAIRDEKEPRIEASAIEVNRPRLARNQVIQTYSVGQLKGEKGRSLFPLFKNEYYEGMPNVATDFLNRVLPAHHIGAYTVLTPEGVRYNYGIPARNITQREATFAARKEGNSTRVNVGNDSGNPSHKHGGTDEFLKITTTPKYAHSYLLTSIVGPDYVDVTQDGITPDDLGYWVKFTYRRVTENYQWRDPFYQAHFIEGWKSDSKDDKGQYTYGIKEIWYLAKAETKSHIAEFSISARADGKGAFRELQDAYVPGPGASQESLYKLDEIKLYSRIGNPANPRIGNPANPIQTVKFDYDYTLCNGIENGNSGKLTLKSLIFKYGVSSKGEMNPYEFNYGNDNADNPDYSGQSFDRWGNYKPCPADDLMRNIDFPYVNQDPEHKATLDREISAWSLKEITLPNGGKIKVDYEADDYAYVQHLPAMQMMEIAPESGNELPLLSSDNLKICFKLEKPIRAEGAEWDQAKQASEVKKYLDLRRGQLYFKCQVYLRKETESNYKEFISGYIDIDPNRRMGLIKEGGEYTKGYFHVQAERGHHPISMRAWQHLRVNQPELSNIDVIEGGSPADKIIAMVATNFISHIRKMLQGFNRYCDREGFGKRIALGKSWIRLFSPDKIKYGGGLRVKQLTQTDEWDERSIYGSCYDYSCEQGGEKISSGVAAYEPMAGGDEISLRYAKKYTNSVPLRADNSLFFEYPINESYYPGPQVGYSKVTVRSLAAAVKAGIALNHMAGSEIIHSGNNAVIGVSGVSVHEFYTAREFPVLAYESDLQRLTHKYDLTIPLLGARSENRLAGSQGYSVITNDMHGKPKKVSQYRIDKEGAMEAQPISWVRYAYRVKESMLDGERIYVLDNGMKDDGYGRLSPPPANVSATHCMGQETDFFLDTREFIDDSWSAGINFNTELLFLFFFVLPIPTFFPNVSTSSGSLHTAVTNKAIFRSGILETTEVYNEGSLLKTKILAWDKNTGNPVLQQINNNYDKPIYSLTTPAYTQYNQMGSAAKNIGMEFEVSLTCSGGETKRIYTGGGVSGEAVQLLAPGDEIEVTKKEDSTIRCLLVCTGKTNGAPAFEALGTATAPPCESAEYTAKIVRSGYRNMIAATAQVLTTLKDPRRFTTKTVTKTVRLPRVPQN